ncbi:auxin response factor 16-like [Silene latifolia]|uniref:auxin response factor 16-like n=1 Tax=Silene latifolia TaxID=37657 RepID=UPI003D76B741
MINVMNPIKEVESNLDPQLWHACAGGMVQMPAVNSKVLYFPQGHLEHGQVNITDLKNYPNLPALIPCRVNNIKFLADQKTDDVFAKITLIPFRGNDAEFSDDGFTEGNIGNDQITENCDNNKPASFAKTLTQSDANNGGGFSVPRYCAETIFPRLDYTANPPVQTIYAKDVHGVTWKFRHIYRGTPRRHLLTTGWSNFVNQKKLVAGDSIVFLRGENGELYVGIRRPKGGIGGGSDCLSGWNNASCGVSSYGGFFRNDEANKMVRNFNGLGSKVARIKGETVLEAFNLAAKGKPFEVVYYPRSSTPEFFIKASVVKAAMQVQWCAGMRFKMPFETEDSSRISWFMGTVSSVQVTDPVRWPSSPWRLLQVAWDEPELLQNVKRVNPWLVELVANMQPMYMSPISPPRKKLRLPQAPDFPFTDQFPIPSFPNSTLGPCRTVFGLPNTVPASIIQGARHSQFGNFMLDLHLNKVNSNSNSNSNPNPNQFSAGNFLEKSHQIRENQPSFLTMATSEENVTKNSTSTKVPFMLFGKPILTEKQMSETSGDSTRSTLSETNIEKMGVLSDSSSEVGFTGHEDHHGTKLGLTIGPCNNVMDSEEFGRSLSLSALGSYEEFYKKLKQHVWHGKVRETEQCAL